MKITMSVTIAACLTVAGGITPESASAAPKPFGIALQHLSSISTESTGPVGAEIVAYDAKTKRAFAINSTDNDLVVLDLTNPAAPVLEDKLSMNAYGAGLNSVAVHDGLVALAVESSPKTEPGKVVFVDAATLAVRGTVTVGALPDMLTFDGDGARVLVANEGEPVSYLPGAVNPQGSISIVDLRGGVGRATVREVAFDAFDKANLLAAGVRVFGPGATAAQDLEPEYITVRGRRAWVTLQEANAIAVIDIPTATVVEIFSLGLKDHSVPGHGLDPSDRDGPANGPAINPGTWPVFGMYQPDSIASFNIDNEQFLITANEGDSRSSDDFPGYNEEIRVGSTAYLLDPTVFPDAPELKANAALGRLTVTSASGDSDGDGDFDRIEVFGARSFSIWNAAGGLVWDSGDRFEQFFAVPENGYTPIFNASNDSNTPDTRSDNKGPEPEGIAIGTIGGREFAFIGLERMGGVMAFDVSDPFSPRFSAYGSARAVATLLGDRGAEGVTFVSGDASPNGQPLVLVGNEVSRTVTIFQVNRTSR